MLKWKAILVALLSFLISPNVFACGLCSGNGYVGAYSTGGYNLYSFTNDIYAIVDTTYYAALPSYGGGCGSLLTGCNSCSSSPSLYGSSGSNPDTQLINQLLINQINQNTTQMCVASGMCNPINPYLPVYGSSPIMTPSMPPVAGVPYVPYLPPVVTPNFPNDPYSPYNPNNPYNPYYSSNSPSTPPSSQLPYGGCDNVVVMCPQGPVTPPGSPGFNWPQFPNYPYTNWPNSGGTTTITYPSPNSPSVPGSGTVTSPEPGFSYTPTYQGGSQTLPQSPLRYQAPRGSRGTH